MSPRQDRPQFESWGRYPSHPAEVQSLFWKEDFPPATAPVAKMLAVGMGRSYGDVCLLKNGTLLRTPHLDRLISFDAQTGLARVILGALDGPPAALEALAQSIAQHGPSAATPEAIAAGVANAMPNADAIDRSMHEATVERCLAQAFGSSGH